MLTTLRKIRANSEQVLRYCDQWNASRVDLEQVASKLGLTITPKEGHIKHGGLEPLEIYYDPNLGPNGKRFVIGAAIGLRVAGKATRKQQTLWAFSLMAHPKFVLSYQTLSLEALSRSFDVPAHSMSLWIEECQRHGVQV